MSDAGRRIFKMETALGVLANQSGADVLDFLGFVISRSVDECCRPAVAPMAKGWLYSMNPEFMKAPFDGTTSFNSWCNEQKTRLGDNVSLEPMPAAEVAGIHALIDTVEAAFQDAADKAAEAAEALEAQAAAEANAKAMAPFKAKAEELEKKVAQLEEKNKGLVAELAEEKAKSAAFNGKIAIDDKDIEKTLKDIITRTVGAMSFAGAGAAAGAAGAEAAAAEPAAFDAPTDSAGAVPDTFGFGASAPSDDGFGF